jgi:hypothetical protein
VHVDVPRRIVCHNRDAQLVDSGLLLGRTGDQIDPCLPLCRRPRRRLPSTSTVTVGRTAAHVRKTGRGLMTTGSEGISPMQ